MQSTPLMTAKHPALPAPAPARSPLGWIKDVGQRLIAALSLRSELQVKPVMTASGIFWHAYDPKTGRQMFAQSEEEVRLWIEENYCEH